MTREEAMKRMGEIYDLEKGNLNSTQLFYMNAALVLELVKNNPKLGDDFKPEAYNYLARNSIGMFSIASDQYHTTQATIDHVKTLLDKKGRPLDISNRGIKSIKNKLTNEHPVPCNVIKSEKDAANSIEEKANVLKKYDQCVILYKEQDKQLSKSTMPEDWDGKDVWARYKNAGIEILDEKINMRGSLKR